ncbi:MAG TPA: hypothetical protein VGQ46_19135 [Thermoanaerobaculia bacterium]|jgi:hypothetical protein|nr:hypothetical protein [Thermoanaerobaculia bacterium]
MHRSSLAVLFVIGLGSLLTCCGTGRTVRGSVLRSSRLPAVTIGVQPSFRYVGRFSFALGSAFEGERFIFADAEGKSLRRMVILQFERVRPSSSEMYRYSFARAEHIGSLSFIQNCFAFPGAQAIETQPRDEGGMTNNFLLERGFQMPSTWLAARFVTLGASDRKSEMIIFYMEANDHLHLSDLYAGDEPTAAWAAMKPALLARARAAFTIE